MSKTILTIDNGKFKINGTYTYNSARNGGIDIKGRLIGVYCGSYPFENNSIFGGTQENGVGKFIFALTKWSKSGVNVISVSLQNELPLPDVPMRFSAFRPNGELDTDFLSGVETVLNEADALGCVVLLNLFNKSHERYFLDEYAAVNGILSIADWLNGGKFKNVLVNITDYGEQDYRSFVLKPNGVFKLIDLLRKQTNGAYYISASIRSEPRSANSLISHSDFIPIYCGREHNTIKMLESIYLYKTQMNVIGRELPVIIAKGDNLTEIYNSYGSNNLDAALESGASWCYFNPYESVSPEIENFFDLTGKITSEN